MALKTKQQNFIVALLQYPSTEEAIRATGIARQTAYRYLEDEEFKNALSEARREVVNGITNQLRNLGGEAIQTLKNNLYDEEATPTSKNQTAKTILDFIYRGAEIEQVEARLDEIENKMNHYNN